MLRMGSSKQWQDTIEVMTGQREMDARPLLEYFQPLYDWLVEENKRTGADIGWSNTHTSK
ncbi:hypothetical protein J6590_062461 [Homalodisca vitripennis]|nr:hypothetical protein J6590_062461 [Homalodisca vitripennis]